MGTELWVLRTPADSLMRDDGDMNSLALLTLFLWVLALARITRLINSDELTDPLRIWVARRTGLQSTWTYFISCPWCVSFWLAIATAWFPLVLVDLPLWMWVFLAPAGSYITGLMAVVDPDDTELVDD